MASFSQSFTDPNRPVSIVFPAGVYYFEAKCWGGGGSGGSSSGLTNNGAGAGGGGGGFAFYSASTMEEFATLTICVGSGGTSRNTTSYDGGDSYIIYSGISFIENSLCIGYGGKSVQGFNNSTGGQPGYGTGTYAYYGGDGVTLKGAYYGGGGGGGAGDSHNGSIGSILSGGSGGVLYGGNGGNGFSGSTGGNGFDGSTYGGGGGGAMYGSGPTVRYGGSGGDGGIMIYYEYAQNILMNIISEM